MLKQISIVVLAVAVLSQGIARADEPAPRVGVTAAAGASGQLERRHEVEGVVLPARQIQGLGYQPGLAQHTPPPKGVLVAALIMVAGTIVAAIAYRSGHI